MNKSKMQGCFFVLIFLMSCFAYSANNFTYDDLLKMIDQNHVTSIDQLIPLLPEKLRSNFTLMYESESLQKASVARPRAILFGSDGKTILSFGGDPKLPGYKNLEVMTYSDSQKSFELHELNFDGGRPQATNPHDLEKKCTTCHGADHHPIWGKYKIWLGAFGEQDDRIDGTRVPSSSDQEAALKKLRDDPSTPNRYRALFDGHKNERENWPYYKNKDADRSIGNMPNIRLAFDLAVLRADQIAKIISQSELFKKMKYSLLYRNICPEPISNKGEYLSRDIDDRMAFLGSMPKGETFNGTISEWAQEAVRKGATFNFFNVPYGATANSARFERDDTSFTGITYGLTDYNDSADFEVKYGGTSVKSYVNSQLANIIGEQDLKLKAILDKNRISYQYEQNSYGGFYKASDEFSQNVDSQKFVKQKEFRDQACGYLAEKARAEVKSLQSCLSLAPESALASKNFDNVRSVAAATRGEEIALGKELLFSKKCVSCHDPKDKSDPLADSIDFGDEKKLAHELRNHLFDQVGERISDHASSRKRMPRSGTNLTKYEQTAMMEYLKSIMEKYPEN